VRPTLLLLAIASLLPALVFALVAGSVGRRPVAEESRRAQLAAQAWWSGMALATGAEGAQILLGAFDMRDLALHAMLLDLLLGGLVLAVWGLLHHVLHIYGAPRWALRALAVVYAGVYVASLYMMRRIGIVGVEVEAWRVDVATTDLLEPFSSWVLGGLIVAPLVLGIGAYALLFRTTPTEQRFRIAVVTFGLVLWVGGIALLGALGSGGDAPQRLLALAFSGFVLVGYFPPVSIRRVLLRAEFDEWRRRARAPGEDGG
jgi:hypothetical protein